MLCYDVNCSHWQLLHLHLTLQMPGVQRTDGVIHFLWSQLLSQLCFNYQQDFDKASRDRKWEIPLESGGVGWVKVTQQGCWLSDFHGLTRRLTKCHVIPQHRHQIWFDVNSDYRVAPPPRGVPMLNEQMLSPLPLLSCRLPSFSYIFSRVMDDKDAGCSLHQTYQAPLGTILCPFAW